VGCGNSIGMTLSNDDDDDGWFGLLWAAWWTRIVLGLALAGAGAYIYSALAAREAGHAGTRMPALFAAIYSALGKTGILAVFLGLAAVCLGSAIVTRLRR